MMTSSEYLNSDKCVEHKTVFVLDHGSKMLESSKQTVELDLFLKNRPTTSLENQHLRSITKSLWTCSMEALCEYCRVVWDIFNEGKLFRFISSESKLPRILNSWDIEEQNMPHLMKMLAEIGPPSTSSDDVITSGLSAAFEALSEATKKQKQFIKEKKRFRNSGRIICITQLKSDLHKRRLTDYVINLMKNQESGLTVDKIELIFIHIKSRDSNIIINQHAMRDVTPKLSVELHDVKATRHGIGISNRMFNLVQQHFDLSATSINGIPMKEEQNSSLSQNYDVLLLHQRLPGTPRAFFNWEAADVELTSSMLLKWRSPKYNTEELYHCTGVARISPVDVNSRPSVCLINFLLNGRCVMLEEWDDEDARGIDSPMRLTHIISCRGDDIYLHALPNPYHDKLFTNIPSYLNVQDNIKSDLRLMDFINKLMKPFTLMPLDSTNSQNENCLKEAENILNQATKYWPLTKSQNVALIITPTLVSTISQSILSNDQITNCQNTIFNLFKMECEKVPLTTNHISNHSNQRINRRSNKVFNYQDLWQELEKLLRSHANLSQAHLNILNCFLKCISKPQIETKICQSEIMESPESPPPVAKKPKIDDFKNRKNLTSLKQIWLERVSANQAKHHQTDFYARLDPKNFKLYPQSRNDDVTATMTSSNQDPRHYRYNRNFNSYHRNTSVTSSSTANDRAANGGGNISRFQSNLLKKKSSSKFNKQL